MNQDKYNELDQAIIDAIDSGARFVHDIYPQVENIARPLTQWTPHYLIRQRLKSFQVNGQANFDRIQGWSAL